MNKTIKIIIIVIIIVVASYVLLRTFVFPGEGEKYEPKINTPNFIKDNGCQWGLEPVIAAIEHEDGSCAYPLGDSYVCVKCGDGVCKNPENKCNCPSDCGE